MNQSSNSTDAPSEAEKPEYIVREYADTESDREKGVQPQPFKNVDEQLEHRIRMKVDLYLVPIASLIFLFSFIDRANIGNARLAGLEKDLGMEGYDFNISLSIFYISYILFEIPCNTVCKWMGPGWFLPILTLSFGVLTMCTGFVQNFSSLCAVRFLLGIFEAGIMPGLVLYLSRWFRQSELTFRISLFIVSGSLAGAFGGLLASAILSISKMGSLHTWRLIFVIEGMATCVLGIACFFILPNGPSTARWLSSEEKEYAVKRVRSERTSSEDELVDKFNWTKLARGIFNPVVFTTSVIFLLNSVTVQGASFFLPTLVATIFPDRGVRTKQLLTVPPYILGAISCVGASYASWRMNKRGVFLIGLAFFSVIGYSLFLASHDPKVRYGAIFLPFFGIYTYGALTNSHVSANVVTETAKSSAIGFNVMFGSIGGLASTWAFVSSDAPYYNIGTGLNLAAQASIIFVASGLYWWIVRDNKRRQRVDSTAVLAGLETSEVRNLDWKHPEFRWNN